jgi:hypothetical protein
MLQQAAVTCRQLKLIQAPAGGGGRHPRRHLAGQCQLAQLPLLAAACLLLVFLIAAAKCLPACPAAAK